MSRARHAACSPPALERASQRNRLCTYCLQCGCSARHRIGIFHQPASPPYTCARFCSLKAELLLRGLNAKPITMQTPCLIRLVCTEPHVSSARPHRHAGPATEDVCTGQVNSAGGFCRGCHRSQQPRRICDWGHSVCRPHGALPAHPLLLPGAVCLSQVLPWPEESVPEGPGWCVARMQRLHTCLS